MSVALAIDGVTKLFGPVMDGIDKLSTNAEERGALRLALYQAQSGMVGSVLDYEGKMVEAQSSVILAEAQGKSWIQRNWRPMVMLGFGFAAVWNIVFHPLLIIKYPEVPVMVLPAGAWTLLTVGIGGYVAGRSGEKIASTLSKGKLDFSKGAGKK